MTEDKEKDQSAGDQHAPQEDTEAASQTPPKDSIDTQREQAADSQEEPQHDSGLQTPQPDQRMPTEAERAAQDSPPDFQPQTDLAPGSQEGIVERPGEQKTDVEEAENDQLESSAEANDDEAVDDPE